MEFSEKDLIEPSLATYLDVAVIRCLFTSQWIEDGIDWALHYILRRLESISKLKENCQKSRCRSNSLQVPKRESFSEKQESKASRPKTEPNTNESTLSAIGEGKLKTSFQDVRRSSFSGLPGFSQMLNP